MEKIKIPENVIFGRLIGHKRPLRNLGILPDYNFIKRRCLKWEIRVRGTKRKKRSKKPIRKSKPKTILITSGEILFYSFVRG